MRFNWALVALTLLSALGMAIDEEGYMAALVKTEQKSLTVEETVRLKSLRPLLEYPNIMFWRPQKVGSSTILSLLTSFGFRYNILTRRRSMGVNYMCRKIALCAYEALDGKSMNDTIFGTDGELFMSLLKDYIKYGSWPLKHHNGTYANQKKHYRGKRQFIQERVSELIGPYGISGDHHICHLNTELVRDHLQCAYTHIDTMASIGQTKAPPNTRADEKDRYPIRKALLSHDRPAGIYKGTNKDAPAVREIFAVRDPLKRLVSIYYFWGELYRIRTMTKLRNARKRDIQLGRAHETDASGNAVIGTLFTYHGNETSVPPKDIANDFATRVTLYHGMPGPSLTWSIFSNDLSEALVEVKKDRIMTIVTERMDESLVVASHYMDWTLADVVVVSPRKTQSQHPPVSAWPKDIVSRMRTKLSNYGEFDMYDAANAKLDSRIADLHNRGKVNVAAEVVLLRSIRSRVARVCLTDSSLKLYSRFLRGHALTTGDESLTNGTWYLPIHNGTNKLRDVEEKYLEYAFDFNHEKLYAYDVCGPCEAHAILLRIDKRIFSRGLSPLESINKDEIDALVQKQPLVEDLNRQDRDVKTNPHFAHCPVGL
jgi:hypothetical protein